MLGAQFISNSAPLLGGGALVSGALTAHDSLFQANSVKLAGAGLYVSGTATLNNTNFLMNSENGFAPGDRGAGGAYVVGDVTVRGGRFQSNSCFSFCLGGGLWALGELVQISGTQFFSNSASIGGGLRVDTLAGTLWLTRTQFISNSADGNGGGIDSQATTFMSGGVLHGNRADNQGGGGLFHGRVMLNGTQVSSNWAGYAAAGIEGDQILIGGSRFENNNASSLAGALLARYSLDIHESLFISNAAPSGGAIYNDGAGNATISNSLFARNQAGDAALVLAQNATYRLLHDTFADTTLNPHAAIELLTGTLYLSDTIVVSHSLVFSQAAGIIDEDYNLFFGNLLVHGGSGGWLVFGGHDVHGEPQFAGAAADNYHLRLTSPAIDAGVNAGVTTDIDGQPRPLGAGFDIGFDEVDVRRVWLPLVKR
jgi:predicted outer membrane repeat protein